MQIVSIFRQRKYQVILAVILAAVILLVWKPEVLLEGIQRSSLYAVIALPMALILGVVGIINLAHGDFMMLGSYLAYWFAVTSGLDPLLAMVPALLAFFLMGILFYYALIKPVLGSPELNQLLLTFGLGLVLEEAANLAFTSAPLKLSVPYVSASLTVGDLTFGTFEFVYVLAAVVVFYIISLFLNKTRTGRAARAVGQNPKGAKLVGIDVNKTYLIIFSLSIALIGAIGVIFSLRHSVFPIAGAPYTMKSFCLIAMAGIGNITGILWYSALLGVSESIITAIPGASGWADLVFFALIVAT
ncbi:MAG: branched-chain amino acid ABC transporter permease, partial [Dehalococcoidia bacterium]|nr:branched-chain amino acid ABC transporter permease [Dehalococcoidia bacterium]